MTFRTYVLNVLGGLTQLLNCLTGGNRDQSFSSRSYEANLLGKAWGRLSVPIVDTLFFFQPDHCFKAYVSDTERTYSVALNIDNTT